MNETDTDGVAFDLHDFIPYQLNQAAELTSQAFQARYKAEYGMTRPQWRVLANLGKSGAMTAAEICRSTHVEKTKVSRAVQALEEKGYLRRAMLEKDRRSEALSLTDAGAAAFRCLGEMAIDYDNALRAQLGPTLAAALLRALAALTKAAG